MKYAVISIICMLIVWGFCLSAVLTNSIVYWYASLPFFALQIGRIIKEVSSNV